MMRSKKKKSLLRMGICCLAILAGGCDSKTEKTAVTAELSWNTVTNSFLSLIANVRELMQGTEKPSAPLQQLVPLSLISWGCELSTEKWVNFLIPVTSEKIKIVTNANLSRGKYEDPDAKWRYALEWQIQDNDTNRVVKSGTYNYETKITKFSSKDIDEPYTAAFYLDSKEVPADGRLFVLNTKELSVTGKPVTLRFRLTSIDPGVSSVSLRVYNLEPTLDRRLDFLWMRTTKRQKDILSQGNVYPSEFLTENEKQNLLRQQWVPIAPQGIAGRDYEARKIYVIRDLEGSPIEEPIIPAGIYVNASLNGTLPIPQEGKLVRLAFSRVGSSGVARDAKISVKWFGLDISQRHTLKIPWDGKPFSWEGYFEGGILEFSSENPVVINPSWIVGDSVLEANPEHLYVRTYAIEKDKSVTYRVTQSNDMKTPFRIDFRALLQEVFAKNHSVKYAILNGLQEVIKEGTLNFQAIPSSFDQALIGQNQSIISDPQSFYFRLSKESPYIRFSSEGQLVVNAYTRPADLIKDTNVPEDYFRETVLENKREPDWFAVRPPAHESLIQDQRSVLIKIQLRPPQDDPDILAGRFWWEQFRPVGNWSGQYVLAPKDQLLPYNRDENLLSGFAKIPIGQPLEIDLRSDCGLTVVRPTLIFLRPKKETPFPFLISVDGELIVDSELVGPRGMFRLPPLTAGTHNLRIECTEEVSFLMNHLASSKNENQVRFANLFVDGGLEVEYLKRSAEDETISMVLYAPYGLKERSTIRVRLYAPSDDQQGPLEGLTVLDRRFNVAPSNEGPYPIINNPYTDMEAGQRMFFPIHSDLPPGWYRIRVDLEEGSAKYLELCRVLPGTFEQREFREEVILDDANPVH